MNIKKYIISSYASNASLDDTQRTAASCILYKYITSLSNLVETNDIKLLINNHAGNVCSWFLALENNYISYELILAEVENINKSFQFYTENNINTIYELYSNKTKIVPFGILQPRPEMYKLIQLPRNKYKYFNNLHNSIMVPISKYYKDNYNISVSSMNINYVNDNFNYIIFSIAGVNISKLLLDVTNVEIGIGSLINDVRVVDDKIHLRIKNN